MLNEGVQPVVQQSTVCPSGSRASRSQTWFREIDARSCVEWVDNWMFRRNLLHWFCEAISDFAKLLSPEGNFWISALLVGALHIATMLLISNWKISISSELFCPSGSRAFAKPETYVFEKRCNKLRRFIHLSNQSTQLFYKAPKLGASRSALVRRAKCGLFYFCLKVFN